MARQRLGFDRLECRRVLAADGQAVPGDADGAQPDIGSSDGASDVVSYQQFSESTTSQPPGMLSGAPARIDGVVPESSKITRPAPDIPRKHYGADRSTHFVIDFRPIIVRPPLTKITSADGCVTSQHVSLWAMPPQSSPDPQSGADTPPSAQQPSDADAASSGNEEVNTLNDSLDVGQWLLIMVPETCEYRPGFYVPVPPVDQVSPTHPGGLPDAQPSDDSVHIAAIAAAVAVVGDDHATDREVATDHVSLEEADEGSTEIETGASGDSTQCDDPSDACAATNEYESNGDEAEVLDEDALGGGWEVGETLDQEQLVE